MIFVIRVVGLSRLGQVHRHGSSVLVFGCLCRQGFGGSNFDMVQGHNAMRPGRHHNGCLFLGFHDIFVGFAVVVRPHVKGRYALSSLDAFGRSLSGGASLFDQGLQFFCRMRIDQFLDLGLFLGGNRLFFSLLLFLSGQLFLGRNQSGCIDHKEFFVGLLRHGSFFGPDGLLFDDLSLGLGSPLLGTKLCSSHSFSHLIFVCFICIRSRSCSRSCLLIYCLFRFVSFRVVRIFWACVDCSFQYDSK
mmetsp:Transcript_24753/g.54336  ORF Transcript_24753/g.54336 Transcript_24753/m.54336 type:complete len:246 (+) Transcript_24753:882-1619(+)